MRNQLISSIASVAAMFGTIVIVGLILGAAYRPEIQSALRTAQGLIFVWLT